MSNIIPFQFDGQAVRVVEINSEPWFVGKDVAEAIGYANATDAIATHCRGVAKRYPIIDSLGRPQEARIISEPDVLRLIVKSGLPSADKFERLVFEEILPTIRKTGSYSLPSKRPVETATEALKLAPLATKAARAFGLDKNAAAISANQFVRKLTGMNLLEDFGHTHLEAENQDAQYFTPTELGARIGVSARRLNQLLAEAGFQLKRGEVWEVMDAGKDFARIYDTGKRHGSGVPIQQIKWAASVLSLLKPATEAA